MEDDYYLDTDIKAQYELDEKIHIVLYFFVRIRIIIKIGIL
jgi:hypothetical protein